MLLSRTLPWEKRFRKCRYSSLERTTFVSHWKRPTWLRGRMFPRSIRRYSSRHSGDARRGWSRGFLLLLELPEHLLRHEAVARVVEVVAVIREDAVRLVVGVVLFPVRDERLAEIVERDLLRLRHLALDLRELLQLGVILVAAVVLLADAGERTLDDLDAGLLQAVDELLQAGLELLFAEPAGVVAADLD